MGRFRKRSVSGGSYKEMSSFSEETGGDNINNNSTNTTAATREQKLAATHKLFQALLRHGSSSHNGKPCLHHVAAAKNPALLTALLDRAQQLDEEMGKQSSSSSSHASIRKQLLLAADTESGYTPLHWAVFEGNLATVLFLLRHALSNTTPRLTQRPMALLESSSAVSSSSSSSSSSAVPLVEAMVTAKDQEGFSAHDLLASRQCWELLACRLSLPRPRISVRNHQGRRHRLSFDIADPDDGDRDTDTTGAAAADEQNEFDLLSRHLRYMNQRRRNQNNDANQQAQQQEQPQVAQNGNTGNDTTYGCEVLTFGQAHHCALGVGNTPTDLSSQQVRPQRVQAFGQSQRGRGAGAVAIAAAAHHTLVATANGELFAFGLGKGGRLGLGDKITHCPTPMRITGGSLGQRRVVGIAAAENHSIALTGCGLVYTWGSNRFGQLSDDGSSRSTPKRVEDLKSTFCVAVAAGAKHSVALSKQGEVYVWGDNTAGQLGISRRNGTHKVQRVDTLWNSSPPKVGIAVAASEQATLVLTVPTGTRLPVNTIYSWGHGSHVPSRVVFDTNSSTRPVNPVAISCALYHNVAVSSDGLVYTWGLHSETLGVQQKPKKSNSSSILASPQLVKGMLPENGGGLAVAVSASENHTAVLTDTGSLFTWGATNGKNVMGHAEVRWQPDPKRVPGVCRAVAVAAAKEHTAFLMGASFPPLPELSPLAKDVNSLEDMAARKISDYVDLFNAVPLLMIAERTNSKALVDYCTEFCRRNLDGVLTVAKRNVLDAYLNEQKSGCTMEISHVDRDRLYHPVLEDLVFAGSNRGPLNTIRGLCEKEVWLSECEELSRSEVPRLLLERMDKGHESTIFVRHRSRSLSNAAERASAQCVDGNVCSDRCRELTRNMDLSTKELAEQKLLLIAKELRGVKKRLIQISKLEEIKGSALTDEQVDKVARRPQLEADLRMFEPALLKVEKKIQNLTKNDEFKPDANRKEDEVPLDEDESTLKSLRCELCCITCPDAVSYTMHMNGRKHRNRVSQAREQEQAEAAAKMIAEHNKQKMLQLQQHSSPKPKQPKTKQIWKTPSITTSPLPCKLPPPPHGTPDSIVPSSHSTKKTLKEIMEEESRSLSTAKNQPKKKPQITAKTPKGQQALPSLSLPVGSAPPLKSPPWASPGAKCVSLSDSHSPSLAPVVPKPTRDDSPFSLDKYISKPQAAELSSSPNPGPVWSTPTTSSVTPSPSTTKKNIVRFAEIQQQELASKHTEVQTVHAPTGETNKWFIQRRERSGSLIDIQSQTKEEREHQLMVEEQFRIEKMIAEENARREKQAARQRKAKQAKTKKQDGGKKQEKRTRQEHEKKNPGKPKSPQKAKKQSQTETQTEKPSQIENP